MREKTKKNGKVWRWLWRELKVEWKKINKKKKKEFRKKKVENLKQTAR
jgi:hypothetical protein